MRFIRKNGRIIPIRDGGKPGKAISPTQEKAANSHGMKVGIVSGLLLTPPIGVAAGFYARHRSLVNSANGKKIS